jgi:hypothetical protein
VTEASRVSCPVIPGGTSSSGTKPPSRLKLICQPAPVAASPTKRSKASPTRPRKGGAARRKRPSRFIVYCRSV